MPSGVNSETGVANCTLQQCVAAKIAAHKGRPSYNAKLLPSIEFIEDALLKPLTFVSNGTGNCAIDSADIAVALLNLDRDLLQQKLETGDIRNAVSCIYYRLNPYLPDEYKYNRWGIFSNFDGCSEPFEERCRIFVENVLEVCMKIEDHLARKYLVNGKANHLEILKRRYRKNWGETANNKQIEIKQTEPSGDKQLQVNIVDA